MWNVTIIILLTIILHITSSQADKILYLSMPLYSHILNFAHIADKLTENGHEVWFSATTELAEKLQFQERKFCKLPFNETKKFQSLVKDISVAPYTVKLETGIFHLNLQPALDLEVLWLTDKLFLSTIESQKFDLIVLNSCPGTEMLSVIPYKYDIPFILYHTFYDPLKLGIPFSPAFVPYAILPYSQNMNFQERLRNTMFFIYLHLFDPFSVSYPVSDYAPEKPYLSCKDILKKAQISLVQWDFILNDPVPLMPHVIPIGQINKRKTTEIPQKFLKFLDGSSNGVIIFSFGSLAPVNDGPIFSKLVSAFLDTKYDFILKGNLTTKSDRLLVSDWIPQASLLTHQNVKLFITHCGMNGISEALSNHVPLLGFPMFADQDGTAHKMETKGFGISMNIALDSKEDITSNINELVTNPQYKENIKTVMERFQDMEKDSLSHAVNWIEHILKYGGDHLKSSSIDMPLYQLLLVDILLVVIATPAFVMALTYKCLGILTRRIFSA